MLNEGLIDVDCSDLQDALDICRDEISRVGDDLTSALHQDVFGFGRDDAPWRVYFSVEVELDGIRLVPSWHLLKFISLLRRSGRA